MTVEELLAEVERRDIRLWVEGGRLRYDAPPGALDDDLRAALRARKPEVIRYLQERRPTWRDCTPAAARVAAAGHLLDVAVKLVEAVDLAERVAALEEQALPWRGGRWNGGPA